jgi:hypothetical protein
VARNRRLEVLLERRFPWLSTSGRAWHDPGNGRLDQPQLILQPSPALSELVTTSVKLSLRTENWVRLKARRRQPGFSRKIPVRALLQVRGTADP